MEKPDGVAGDRRQLASGNAADPSVAIRSRFGPIAFSDEDLAAADRVVEEISARASWFIPEAIAKLQAAWEGRDERNILKAVKKVRAIAHDLAGLGETLGYPTVTTLARSLCRFIDLCDLERPGASEIIDAQVAALNGVVKNRMSRRRDGMAETIATTVDGALKKFHSQ